MSRAIYKDPDLWIAVGLLVLFTILWIFVRVDWLQTLAIGFSGLVMGALKAGLGSGKENGNGEKP